MSATPGWYPDPFGRHEFRHWTGLSWSEYVADHGQTFVDPTGLPPPHPAPQGVAPATAQSLPAPGATGVSVAPVAATATARRSPMLKWGAGVGVLALVAGGVYLVTRDDGGSASTSTESGVVTSATDLTLESDGVTLVIPAGAVPPDRNGASGQVVVSVDRVDMPADVDTTNVASGVTLSDTVYQIGPEGQTFTVPVALTLPIPDNFNPDQVGGLAYLDPASRQWVTVPAEVDAAARTATAMVTHFSPWTMWQSDQSRMQSWRDTHGGYFDVTNNASMSSGYPNTFFDQRAPRYNSYSVTYGFCVRAMNFDDPAMANDASWYIPGDLLFTVYASPNQPGSGGTRAFWLPAGTYTVDEVWFGSEINPGDPMYVPIYGSAFRPLGNITVGIGTRKAFDRSTVQPDAATGWQVGRPTCAGVLNPSLGTGDLQITLNWPQTGVDLDLHVVDPSGTEIYYNNKTSPTGGQLDWDNQYGGGTPENIFWSTGGAPKGTYTVTVVYFSGGIPATWSVRTVVNGRVETFGGTITPGADAVQVTTFTIS